MRKYLLSKDGTFYKANLHTHTTVSDGSMTPEEIKKHYMENGYSVVAFTDHDIMVPHPELAEEAFLPLNGYEMEVTAEGDAKLRFKKTCHMCFIAKDPENLTQVCFHRSKYLVGNGSQYLDKIRYDETLPDYERHYCHESITDMMKTGRENGFYVTYNHPTWSLETYADYMGYNHMHAMEIYNFECDVTGYCDYNEKEYDDMLRGGKRIHCIAADDCHSPHTCCGGFIMIKAEKLEYKVITDALSRGDFYASQGPEIHDLWFENGTIHIDCSDAASITLHTGSRRAIKLYAHAIADGILRSADFDVLPEDKYVRITVEDAKGKHANTNAFFTDELFQ